LGKRQASIGQPSSDLLDNVAAVLMAGSEKLRPFARAPPAMWMRLVGCGTRPEFQRRERVGCFGRGSRGPPRDPPMERAARPFPGGRRTPAPRPHRRSILGRRWPRTPDRSAPASAWPVRGPLASQLLRACASRARG
jgi:hypothetical protein